MPTTESKRKWRCSDCFRFPPKLGLIWARKLQSKSTLILACLSKVGGDLPFPFIFAPFFLFSCAYSLQKKNHFIWRYNTTEAVSGMNSLTSTYECI